MPSVEAPALRAVVGVEPAVDASEKRCGRSREAHAAANCKGSSVPAGLQQKLYNVRTTVVGA